MIDDRETVKILISKTCRWILGMASCWGSLSCKSLTFGKSSSCHHHDHHHGHHHGSRIESLEVTTRVQVWYSFQGCQAGSSRYKLPYSFKNPIASQLMEHEAWFDHTGLLVRVWDYTPNYFYHNWIIVIMLDMIMLSSSWISWSSPSTSPSPSSSTSSSSSTCLMKWGSVAWSVVMRAFSCCV